MIELQCTAKDCFTLVKIFVAISFRIKICINTVSRYRLLGGGDLHQTVLALNWAQSTTSSLLRLLFSFAFVLPFCFRKDFRWEKQPLIWAVWRWICFSTQPPTHFTPGSKLSPRLTLLRGVLKFATWQDNLWILLQPSFKVWRKRIEKLWTVPLIPLVTF